MALHFLLDEAVTAGVGDTVTLTGAEARHAATVRRVRVGEAVTVGDGFGAWLQGEVESIVPGEVVIRVSARADTAPAHPRLVLVQALAKGDRDELAVQAATELGVDDVLPWQASRSVSRWDGAKAAKGRARWATIVREAAKQAHRAWVPTVAEPVTTTQLAKVAASARVLVLEPTAEDALTSLDLTGDDRDLVLVVGPEGGIAPEELQSLQTAGAQLVRLGDTVLRTSTAGPAALAIVSAALGRW
jgi:16S rRNA (uracil1498-N3)-methyltransferase